MNVNKKFKIIYVKAILLLILLALFSIVIDYGGYTRNEFIPNYIVGVYIAPLEFLSDYRTIFLIVLVIIVEIIAKLRGHDWYRYVVMLVITLILLIPIYSLKDYGNIESQKFKYIKDDALILFNASSFTTESIEKVENIDGIKNIEYGALTSSLSNMVYTNDEIKILDHNRDFEAKGYYLPSNIIDIESISLTSGTIPKERDEIIISDDLALVLKVHNVIDSETIGETIEVNEQDAYESQMQDMKIVGTYSSNKYNEYSFINNYNLNLSHSILDYAQNINYEIYDEDYNRENRDLCGLDTCALNYSYEKYIESGIVGTMIPDENKYMNTSVKNAMYIEIEDGNLREEIEGSLLKIYPYADVIDNSTEISDFNHIKIQIYASLALLIAINLVISKKEII